MASGGSTTLRSVVAGPYAITFASIGAAALGNVVCYKLVALLGTALTLSDYSTARRYLNFVLPVMLLGAGVALPLRTALRPHPDESRRILYLQFGCALVLAVLALTALGVFPDLGTAVAPGLGRSGIAAVIVMAFAFNCTSMLYAYYRGFQDFRRGAILVILANGVFPSMGAALAGNGANLALVVWAGLCLAMTGLAVRRLGWPGWGVISERSSLLRSSLGRMPGDLAYAAVFLLPVAQMQGATNAHRQSVFNYFFVVLGVITAASAPISAVLLPVVGRRVATRGRSSARRLFAASIGAGIVTGMVVWLAVNFESAVLVRAFLSQEYVAEASVIKALGPAALGLALFVFVKSVLDGAGEAPLTAIISIMALVVYGATRAIVGGPTEDSVVTATNWAFGFLGVATVLTAGAVFSVGRRSVATPSPELDLP